MAGYGNRGAIRNRMLRGFGFGYASPPISGGGGRGEVPGDRVLQARPGVSLAPDAPELECVGPNPERLEVLCDVAGVDALVLVPPPPGSLLQLVQVLQDGRSVEVFRERPRGVEVAQV